MYNHSITIGTLDKLDQHILNLEAQERANGAAQLRFVARYVGIASDAELRDMAELSLRLFPVLGIFDAVGLRSN